MIVVKPFAAPNALHAKRGHPAVQRGQTLYGLWSTDINRWFIWAYQDQDFAYRMASRITIDGPTDIRANWRPYTHQLSHSARKSFK